MSLNGGRSRHGLWGSGPGETKGRDLLFKRTEVDHTLNPQIDEDSFRKSIRNLYEKYELKDSERP